MWLNRTKKCCELQSQRKLGLVSVQVMLYFGVSINSASKD
jgi:hypothetical protein